MVSQETPATEQAPVAAPAVEAPVVEAPVDLAEAHELAPPVEPSYLEAPIPDEVAKELAAEEDIVVPSKEEVIAAGYSDPEPIIARQQKLADLQKAKRAELAAVAPVVEEPAPAHVVDPSFVPTPEGVEAFSSKNTDNHDSRGSYQADQPEFGPRGNGVPADAFAPDNRSPIDKHFDAEGKATTSKNTVTDNVDSRGDDQGDQPDFGPRGFGAKSSPETFRH